MSRNSAVLLLLATSALTGCADYLNRYDTVTLAAGDTQKYKALLQTKDPFNPASKDTAITTDGQRASDAVIYKYKTTAQPGGAPSSTSNAVDAGASTDTN